MRRIYLDNAATTAVDPRVRDAMLPYLGERFGNPSSIHGPGAEAAAAIEAARALVADAVGCGPWRVIFTSGGTEADTLALQGSAPRGRRRNVVLSAIEHPAVDETAAALAARGLGVARVPAPDGVVDPEAFASHADRDTAVAALIAVQNEIGTIQPVAEAARRIKARSPEAVMHVDAVQALGQLERLDLPDEVDTVAVSAHKIHGPKGAGALLVRPGVTPKPLFFGGDQQGRARPGTENVAGIVGFGTACRLLCEERVASTRRMAGLAARLKEAILASVPDVQVLGRSDALAPALIMLGVRGTPSEVMLRVLEAEGVIVSAGSACHSGHREPSAALRAGGLKPGWGALRLSLSRFTTDDDVTRAAGAIAKAAAAIREGRVAP